jgi:hypothetical protein
VKPFIIDEVDEDGEKVKIKAPTSTTKDIAKMPKRFENMSVTRSCDMFFFLFYLDFIELVYLS